MKLWNVCLRLIRISALIHIFTNAIFSLFSVITSLLEYHFLCDKINHTNSTLLIKTTYHAFLLLLLVVAVVVLQALAFIIEVHLCRNWYYWLKAQTAKMIETDSRIRLQPDRCTNGFKKMSWWFYFWHCVFRYHYITSPHLYSKIFSPWIYTIHKNGLSKD